MEWFVGHWKSETWPVFIGHGAVRAQLPVLGLADTEGQALHAELKYYGLHRKNQEETFPLVMGKQGQAKGTQHYVTPAAEVQGRPAPSGQGQLLFKVETWGPEEVTGRYKLTHPKDVGVFQLKRAGSQRPAFPDDHEACVIS